MFRKLSFKWKLTFILMLTCVVSLVVACGAFIGFEMYSFRESNRQELDTLSQLLSSKCKDAVQRTDRKAIKEALANLSGNSQIVAAGVYSSEKELIGMYYKEGSDEVVPVTPHKISHVFEGNHLVTFKPIEENGERIGMLYLKADIHEKLMAHVWRYINIGGIVLLISCLVAFAASYKLQLIVSRPLMELAQTAKTVSENKDFSVRAVKLSNDEIGQMIDAFNGMLVAIQARDVDLRKAYQKNEEANEKLRISNDRLEDYNRTLEQKVEARTSELVKATHEAEEAREAAEIANSAKSGFLANMSHELRTPLNAIIGYSEMMIDEAEDLEKPEFADDLKKVHAAGKHLLGLINDVLDISKIESGKMELYLENFAVTTLVREVSQTIAPLVSKNGNVLKVECPSFAGSMHADQTKVRQGLFNLLSNACKFTKQGTISLTVSRETAAGRDWIVFRVSDTGIGLTEDQMKRLFQPFVQADAGTTKKFGGTGLGLAITRRFCQMMGGDALVESEYGKGSTFILRLPAESQSLKSEHTGKATVSISDQLESATNGTRILVIDDDPTVHDLMKRMLSKKGYQVVVAGGGVEGLRLAAELKPDAITLDVMMPDMDGWTVLTALKANPDLADIPVVMLSMVADKHMGFTLGAADCLTKPIKREQIAAVLGKYRRETGGALVLVVDDDPDVRAVMRAFLEKEGCTVFEAENGVVALEEVARSRPTLILLDLTMPEMDGFEFLVRLRESKENADIPVVVITGAGLSDEERRRLDGYAQQILLKGRFDGEGLFSNLQDVIHRINKKPAPEAPEAG